MDKNVVTISGKTLPKNLTIPMRNAEGKWEYLEKDVDCFRVGKPGNSKYLRKDNQFLRYDLATKLYVDARVTELNKVISGIDENGKLTYGYSSWNFGIWQRTGEYILGADIVREIIMKEENLSKPIDADAYYTKYKGIFYDHKTIQITKDVNTGKLIPLMVAKKVIIDWNDKVPIYGYTLKEDESRNVYVVSSSGWEAWCFDETVAEAGGYYEDFMDGIFRVKGKISGKKGIREYVEYMHDKKYWESRLKASTSAITEGLKYTFGVEIETIRGLMPRRLMVKVPFKCLRDGSLGDHGGEYVSSPLMKDKGFEAVEIFLKEAKKRCQVNYLCSFHVHIGGVPCTKYFNTAIYHLGRKIQSELFAMLPYSRTNHKYNEDYSIKKNYCKPLPEIVSSSQLNALTNASARERFNKILKHVDSEINKFELSYYEGGGDKGVMPGKGWERIYNRKSKLHSTETKWNRAARYYWLNLLNMNFDKKCTVEIRCHSGSLNYRKIKNWILICMAICHYAEHKFKECVDPKRTITLAEIMKFAYPKGYGELIKYIEERKNHFSKTRTLEYMKKVEEEEYSKDE